MNLLDVMFYFPRLHILSTSAEVHNLSTISFLLEKNSLSSQKTKRKTNPHPFGLAQIEEWCANLHIHRNVRNLKGVTRQGKVITTNVADSRCSFSSEHTFMIQGGPCTSSKNSKKPRGASLTPEVCSGSK